MKKIVTFIIIWVSSFLLSQTSRKEIDDEYRIVIQKLRNEGKYEEIIKHCDRLIESSKKIGYLDGEIEGYAKKGDYYIVLGKSKESIANLKIAEKLSAKSNNYRLKALIAIAIGRNYNEQNISQDLAIKKFRQGEVFATKINNRKERETYIVYAYDQLIPAYFNSKKNDSALYYIKKSLHYDGDHLPYLYNELAHYHIEHTKNSDSALYYLKKSEQHQMTAFNRSLYLLEYGNYFRMLKDYGNASKKYRESLEASKSSQDVQGILDALQALKDTYHQSGDKQEEIRYSRQYIQISDSLKNISKESTKELVNYAVNSTEEQLRKEKTKNNTIIITLIVLGCVTTISGLLVFYNLRKKNRILSQKKKEILENKEQEINKLKTIVNEAFEEVIILAKSNSPEFFTRFREVYPEVVAKLLEINPKLSISELTFSAYIFLGFNTKDIMNVTFTSINTVKSRKYYLRKKLNIPAEVSTEMWFRNIEGNRKI